MPSFRWIVLAILLSLGSTAADAAEPCYFGACADSVPRTTQQNSFPQRNYGDEATDFGVAPQSYLQTRIGSPTPLEVPGAMTVTTRDIVEAARAGKSFALIDAWNDQQHATLPGAVRLPFAGQAGNFEDDVQATLLRDLARLTQSRLDYPLIFFCAGSRCWESYNAVLRARQIGFTNLFWYRGGIAAWQDAGLPPFN